MVLMINETGILGQAYAGMNAITGSVFLTLLSVVLVLMLVAMIFRMPIEFTAVFILPSLLTFLAFESEFLAVGGVILIYLGILLGKNLFFNR